MKNLFKHQKGGFHQKQLLVPEFSNVYSGGAQGDIEYQEVLIVVHIHTVHITLPLMAKFKPAKMKAENVP
jgi:hypothetical protein